MPVTPPPSPLARAVAPLVADPSRSALLFDFDGTLSPVVDVPDDARPLPGVVELLDRLAARYRTVAAVSGRPVEFLASHLPASLTLSGLYGLEAQVAGERRTRAGVDGWRSIVAEATERARAADIEGLFVEPKGLSVTLHFRTHPRSAAAVSRLAAALAAETGLEARPAKMSLELHPPVASDKGLVVHELAAGAAALLYAGDDLGDLPAFDALAALRAQGTATLGVAVDTPELPTELRTAADLLVSQPTGVIDLLEALLR